MGSVAGARRAAGAVALVALVACAGNASATKKAAENEDRTARVGRAAPNWSEPTDQGTNLALASLRGKVVYLNFFATWCPPCNEEAPAIDALQRQYGSKGLQIVGVDVLENARKAALFRSEHHLSYPAVVDDGTLRDQYAINGLPVHVFIDRQGTVRSIVVGELSAGDMRANVLRLLARGRKD
ncbi:MAG: TlpA disulfide reductase family protein [Candidatus Tumulicola sp.]